MEIHELHRGRLIDHLQLVVKDLAASKRFYLAVFEVLGIPLGGEAAEHFWVDELFVSSQGSREAQGKLTGRVHLAFQAPDRPTVDLFYRAAPGAGGRHNGPPGGRPHPPDYSAAFVLDPHAKNIEAVYHGAAKRSADSVKITFTG
jgi:lactoylglutathione lyase